MKELDKAYIGGLIDGEGTITLSKLHKSSRRAPVISFPNTCPELIARFHQLCGGHICNKKTTKKHHSPSKHVSLKYDAVLKLLTSIQPYIYHPIKRYRADLLLSEYKTVTPRNGKYTPALEAARIDFEHRFFHPK